MQAGRRGRQQGQRRAENAEQHGNVALSLNATHTHPNRQRGGTGPGTDTIHIGPIPVCVRIGIGGRAVTQPVRPLLQSDPVYNPRDNDVSHMPDDDSTGVNVGVMLARLMTDELCMDASRCDLPPCLVYLGVPG